MITRVEINQEPRSLARFLAGELAPRKGRGAAVGRISVACAITVMIAMIFRIPQPAYMAYIVFAICKDDQAATFKTAIGAVVSITLAVLVCILLFVIDVGEPALRLPAMAIMTFVGMYTSRIFALGPISFLAGFIVVLVQSLVDDVPKLESLTRTTLWLWVVVMVPVAVAMLTNLVAGQSTAIFIKNTVLRVLMRIHASLCDPAGRSGFAGERAEVLSLLTSFRNRSPLAKSHQPVNDLVIRRLLDVLTMLEGLAGQLPMTAAHGLAHRVRAIEWKIKSAGSAGEAARPMPEAVGPMPDGPGSPSVPALEEALGALDRSIGSQPADAPPELPAEASAPRGLFIPDAFSNPEYLRFALKSTIAVMTTYGIYTLLNYPGMRTSITTCFFVALGTLGETVHKLVLRISGAIIGGIAAALCIVFLLPSLTDIGQLSILVACVAAGCAWIATSTERLSYAGMQIAFAFFLGVLHGYVPATELTVLRDRVAGILLGNIIVTLTFSVLWPESAYSRLRVALAELFNAIAGLLKAGGPTAAEARLRVTTALVRIDQYSGIQQFELNMLGSDATRPAVDRWTPALSRLAAATFVVSSAAFTPSMRSQRIDVFARWATAAAGDGLGDGGLPPAPRVEPAPADEPGPADEPERPGNAQRLAALAAGAEQELQRQIDHVVVASQ